MFRGRHFSRTVSVAISLGIGSTQSTSALAAMPRPPSQAIPLEQTLRTFEALLHRVQTAPNTPTTPSVPSNDPTPSSNGGGSSSSSSGSSGAGSSSTSDGSAKPLVNLNDIVTGKVRKDFDAAVNECNRYDPVYRIDCLRANIELIAQSLPRNGAYRETRQILFNASSALENIVRQNQDLTAPRLDKPSGANKRYKKRQRYRAIKPEKLATAMSQARAVIEEAQTQLLRSSENSAGRLAHYQTIAAAVGSTKVLLRST